MAAGADALDQSWDSHSIHPLNPKISSADARMLGHTGVGVGVSVGGAEGRALGSRLGMSIQCLPTSLASSRHTMIPTAQRLMQEAPKSMLSLPQGRVWAASAEAERVVGAGGGGGVNGSGVGRPMGRDYAYLGFILCVCLFVAF
jgi:hypothetical protein